ncbi:MAG TPA: PAS domain S-box protein [Kiritimatiellia bacterium]|nr:PAS domain S-box protein [Kiritimatiellia bacterium]
MRQIFIRFRLPVALGAGWACFVAACLLILRHGSRAGFSPQAFGLPADTSPLFLFAGAALAGGLLLVLLADFAARRRMRRVIESVREVRAQADFEARMPEAGTPENRELAAEINGLLGTLQRIHHKLETLNTDLGRRVEERTRELQTSRDAMAEDAAHRIAAERANLERERVYRTIHELSPSGILLESGEGLILDINESLCQTLGYTREELIGQHIRRIVPTELHERIARDIDRVLDGHTLFHEVENRRKNGERCFMELRERAITLPGGERRIIVVANDVTVRKANEERLRESEQRYHTLFNTLITGFALHEIVCDDAGRPIDYIFLDVNPAFTALTGRRRDEVVGHRCTEIFPGTETVWIERYGKVALEGGAVAFENFAAAIGRHFSVIAFSPQRGQFAVNFVDITEQKRAEDQLRLHGAALESAANGIMIVSREGLITWVNKAFTALTGFSREEAIGQNPRIMKSGRHAEPFYRQLWDAVLAGRMWRGELVNRRKDGSLYLEEMTVTPVLGPDNTPTHFVSIKQDITERRDLQQQLFQSQKMEVIGRLAGGIAHDFNNLLQAITGFSHLLLESLDEHSPYRGDVLEIDRAARRASDLTRQLLAFSRRQMIEPKPLDINVLVEGTEKMLRRLIGEDIHLELDLESGLDPVRADAGQIEQVLVNLTVNARDAMTGGGRLTINTSSIVLLKEDTLFTADSRHGRFVVLSITDTGPGMSPEVREHIFEPFFTTKGPGRGTGLGLSVVYGIIQQHEGMIRVYSEVGQGTTFRIYLPVSEEQTGVEEDKTETVEGSAEMPRGRGERILLVEDEAGVRDFATAALRLYGYEPIVADSALAAEQLYIAHDGRFDLLFTDVVLADQTGLDLAADLRKRNPGLRLLFTSGYMDEKSRWPIIRDRGYPFLQKPYPLERLLVTIRQVLDQPPPA